jgi:hypothetical protein
MRSGSEAISNDGLWVEVDSLYGLPQEIRRPAGIHAHRMPVMRTKTQAIETAGQRIETLARRPR